MFIVLFIMAKNETISRLMDKQTVGYSYNRKLKEKM
jgi:hypothetical protein